MGHRSAYGCGQLHSLCGSAQIESVGEAKKVEYAFNSQENPSWSRLLKQARSFSVAPKSPKPRGRSNHGSIFEKKDTLAKKSGFSHQLANLSADPCVRGRKAESWDQANL